MAEGLEDELRGLDVDRPLPPALYRRLEEALVVEAGRPPAGASDDEDVAASLFDALDAPRPIPPAARTALERELASPSRGERPGRVLLAAAAALLLVLGTLAALRAGGSSSSSDVAARSTRSVPAAGQPPVLLAPTTIAGQGAAGGGAASGGSPAPQAPVVRGSTTTTTWNCGLCARNGVARSGTAAAAAAPTSTLGGQGGPAQVAGPAVLPAQISSVQPSSGPRGGGTIVTVTGFGFTGASGVLFGSSSAANFTVVSDSEIRVMAPASSRAQTVAVAVAYPDGTTTSSNGPGPPFTYR